MLRRTVGQRPCGNGPLRVVLQPAEQQRSYNATYGMSMRSHQGVVAAFLPVTADQTTFAGLQCKDGVAFADRVVPLLESVEERLSQWRLARWEFRIPASIQSQDRETAKRQLALIRQLILDRLQERQAERQDLEIISNIVGDASPEQLRSKSREWFQDKVSDLRWKGDVGAARTLREAWSRLEKRGGPQSNLLERLSYIYSLARLGTFDNAFANTIVPAASKPTTSASQSSPIKLGATGKTSLFSSLHRAAKPAEALLDPVNPLESLLQLTLVNVPSVAILHDFLGLNSGVVVKGYGSGPGGYRDALGAYMAKSVREQLLAGGSLSNSTGVDPGVSDDETVVTREGYRVPRAFAAVADAVPTAVPQSLLRASGRNKKNQRVAVFDYRVAAGSPTFPAPPCDFAFLRGSEVTLVTIASPNKYIRETQIISSKQASGIARRAAMLLGTDISEGKCRTLLLPPNYLDKANLDRLSKYLGVDGDLPEQSLDGVPADCRGWVQHYQKQLSDADVDYAAQAKKSNEEEWYRL